MARRYVICPAVASGGTECRRTRPAVLARRVRAVRASMSAALCLDAQDLVTHPLHRVGRRTQLRRDLRDLVRRAVGGPPAAHVDERLTAVEADEPDGDGGVVVCGLHLVVGVVVVGAGLGAQAGPDGAAGGLLGVLAGGFADDGGEVPGRRQVECRDSGRREGGVTLHRKLLSTAAHMGLASRAAVRLFWTGWLGFRPPATGVGAPAGAVLMPGSARRCRGSGGCRLGGPGTERRGGAGGSGTGPGGRGRR